LSADYFILRPEDVYMCAHVILHLLGYIVNYVQSRRRRIAKLCRFHVNACKLFARNSVCKIKSLGGIRRLSAAKFALQIRVVASKPRGLGMEKTDMGGGICLLGFHGCFVEFTRLQSHCRRFPVLCLPSLVLLSEVVVFGPQMVYLDRQALNTTLQKSNMGKSI
jgi:hypothetical protein